MNTPIAQNDSGKNFLEDHKLFKLAYWSDKISWFVLVLSLLKTIIGIVGQYLQWLDLFREDFSHFVYCVLAELGQFIYVLFFFFILQVLSEVLYLMLDIREQGMPQENAMEPADE